jgi:hypothetical protein
VGKVIVSTQMTVDGVIDQPAGTTSRAICYRYLFGIQHVETAPKIRQVKQLTTR